MITSSARPKYDAAILGAEYENGTARFLTDCLHAELGDDASIWTRDPIADTNSATTAQDACANARAVVVLHDRLWGRASRMSGDRESVQARIARSGGSSIFFVPLDETPLPAWARKAKVSDLGQKTLDECIETLAGAIRVNGARTSDQSPDAMAARLSREERYARDRDAYLGSHRSGPACARELERLTDDLVDRIESMERPDGAAEIEVKRGAGRCIIQLGPVALTVSWIRARTDAVIEGRLMIMEWDGVVRRGTDQLPERVPVRHTFPPATLLREDVYVADAATEQNWRWRRDGRAPGMYTSRDLATRCLASLEARLEESPVVAAR
jgi:hypothetical protein